MYCLCIYLKKIFDFFAAIYRKDGGYGKSGSAQIVEMFKNGIEQGNSSKLEKLIEQFSKMNLPENGKYFLEGDRDISLAIDPKLKLKDAVEFHLLLEWLGKK